MRVYDAPSIHLRFINQWQQILLAFPLAFKGFSLFPKSHCELTISDAVNLLGLI